MIEYGRRGLAGVLTPQANTTVEAEFNILLPPGFAAINARLVSPKVTIEARLLDYFESASLAAGQFANAPLGMLAFACTGTSYLVGRDAEDRALAALSKQFRVPVFSAATAVVAALQALGAKDIALISPYEGALDQACAPYWHSRGFRIARKVNTVAAAPSFHPIYALASDAAAQALEQIADIEADAIVMLGTGMPTLAPIARQPFVGSTPVLSCMYCLVWASAMTLAGLPLKGADLQSWLGAGWWRDRLRIADLLSEQDN